MDFVPLGISHLLRGGIIVIGRQSPAYCAFPPLFLFGKNPLFPIDKVEVQKKSYLIHWNICGVFYLGIFNVAVQQTHNSLWEELAEKAKLRSPIQAARKAPREMLTFLKH